MNFATSGAAFKELLVRDFGNHKLCLKFVNLINKKCLYIYQEFLKRVKILIKHLKHFINIIKTVSFK